MKHLRWVAIVCLTIAYIDTNPQLTAAKQDTHLSYLPLVGKHTIPLERLWLAFSSNRDGNWEIYSMRGDGQSQFNLTNNPAWDEWPLWSPVGAQIVFSSNRDGDFEIYRMQANCKRQVNLTNSSSFDGHPAWSSDGSQIAFRSDRDEDAEIYVMNSDGTNPVNLTRTPGYDDLPAWSPDGTQIAFVSKRDGDTALYVMQANGASQARLASTSHTHQPTWSPDSSTIAHVLDHEMYLTTVSDATTIQLTKFGSHPTTSYMGDPAWSPSGAKLAFHFVPYIYSPSALTDIYTIQADGSEPRGKILASGHSPDWSPDGAYIVFSTKSYEFAGLKARIVRMRSDGSEQTTLADQGDNFDPTWTYLPPSSP